MKQKKNIFKNNKKYTKIGEIQLLYWSHQVRLSGYIRASEGYWGWGHSDANSHN